MKYILCLVSFFIFLSNNLSAKDISQWRGSNRDGVYSETGLLKKWPEGGLELKWFVEGLGNGYSSVSVSDDVIYATGKNDSVEYLTAIDKSGKQLWQIPYGLGCMESFPDTRCTPTIEGEKVYLISGRGEVVCVNIPLQKKNWSVDAFSKFDGKHNIWEIAESPLLVDNKVIYTPAGDKTTIVALDKKTGETVWTSKSLNDTTAYVSPILINYAGKNIIVNILSYNLVGVDAKDGKILWSYNYSELEKPTWHPNAPYINCVSPIYHDGQIFITSGYDHTSAMFTLAPDANSISLAWTQPALDTHHGGVVLVDGYIYGSNWINNSKGNWVCLDWKTGEVKYEKEWISKGSIIYADGMLYCYEEKRGTFALVKATPKDFEIVNFFPIKKGSGRHWAHPVISDGVLYVRHGDVLMAYDIKE